jgi:cytochrome P450 family 6
MPAKIPMGCMGSVGFTEHISEMTARECPKFKNISPVHGTYFFTMPTLIVTEPEVIKEIYVKHFENFHDHGIEFNEKADPLSGHLFFLSGEKWKDMRTKLSPTFTSGKMKMMFPFISSIGDRMVDYLTPYAESGEMLEMKEIYSSYTTEVISSVAFGIDMKCLGNPENAFRKMARNIFEPSALENFRLFLIFSFPKIAKWFNSGFNTKETNDFFMSATRDTLKMREESNFKRNDFFQLLMDIKNSPEGMSFNDMAANSFVFFAAG